LLKFLRLCAALQLARLEQVSGNVFHEVTQKGSILFKEKKNNLLPILALNELSARKIQTFAEDLKKTKKMIRKTMSFLTKFIRILELGPVSLMLLKNILFRNLWYGLLFYKKKQTRNGLRI